MNRLDMAREMSKQKGISFFDCTNYLYGLLEHIADEKEREEESKFRLKEKRRREYGQFTKFNHEGM